MRQKYDAKLRAERPEIFFDEHQEESSRNSHQKTIPSMTVSSTNQDADGSKRKLWHFAALGAVCFMLGWIGGREYLRYEFKQAISEAFAPKENSQPKPKAEDSASNKRSKPVDAEVKQEANNDSWKYNEYKDGMRGTKTEYAELVSSNELNLGFPYQKTYAVLGILKNQDAVAITTNAQFNCYETNLPPFNCIIAVKFDDNEIEYIQAIRVKEDVKAITIAAKDSAGFIDKVRRSNQLIVELPMFQDGNQQFTFEVKGFKW